MVSYRLVAAAGFFASVYALPLNINLGAYSPALVVGDGEISFGGGQDVSKLFTTLEGAAQQNAAGGGAAKTAGAAAPASQAGSQAASVPASSSKTEGQSAAAAAPPAAKPSTPAPEVAAQDTTIATSDATLQDQASSVSTLQGMGKEIAPRDVAPEKRDLAGFDRALKYAEAALVKGPIVQLGTGKEGAGVGIIVDNRPAGGAAAKAEGAAAKAQGAASAGVSAAAADASTAQAMGKRSEEESTQPRRRTKVTTMYVRRGVPAELQTTKSETRDIKSIPAVAASMLKRDEDNKRETTTSTSIDSINLNVDDPQGLTMTFVETSEDQE
ncbi:uncharacterized protein PG998_006909 [Apiospora kogelbergensis]|uniref:Uncharacterized protein n=1 Tax=Apiospora kogelbergensis TaxID=1337665 RepID=A0AAW0QHF9_9PEZI